MTTKWKID